MTQPRQLPFVFPEGRIPSFELYYPGPNREVFEHVRRLSEAPTSLYLWGPSGTGKTHLLQAAGHEFTALGRRACYLALAQNAALSPTILEGLEDLDLVCIDELHSVAENREWERALLRLYERLRDFGRCFVLASLESPGFINIDLPDLKSRLAWGLVFHLRQLDECDKIRALQWRAKLRGAIRARWRSYGRPLALNRFFIGLTNKTTRLPLLTLGVITLAAYVFLSVVTMADPSLYSTIESLLRADASTGIVAIVLNLFVRFVLSFMILSLATMALLYSCPAIFFAGSDAFDAMMNSIETCAHHWRAFTAFMCIFIGLAIVAMIPMGLGLLVLMPVTFCAAYASYQMLHASAQTDSNVPG